MIQPSFAVIGILSCDNSVTNGIYRINQLKKQFIFLSKIYRRGNQYIVVKA